ncbi:glutamine-hydrolyzing GMP synthase [bacterium]|nr:glutamine-hydrolyzing GMP synthase [bacterium]
MVKNYILIIDFGSQYTHIIAKKIRQKGVFTKIQNPLNVILKDPNIKGIILSGGPASVYDEGVVNLPLSLNKIDVPILGICYGFQYIIKELKGKISKAKTKEYGNTTIKIINKTPIYRGIGKDKINTWMSHGDIVKKVPNDFIITAISQNNIIVSAENQKNQIYGLQFHPEVYHTEYGEKILKNFIDICKIKEKWKPENEIEDIIRIVRSEVGKECVGLAISGGVDSTVLGIILKKALGKNLFPVFIDNGLLRKNEVQMRKEMFRELGLNVKIIDASKEFLTALSNVRAPSKKRKIIGKVFIDILGKYFKNNNIKILAQGTLYPDVIESKTVVGKSSTIKLHHNVGGLPKDMEFKLLEPFKFLFKDDVRRIGKNMGIAREVLLQHPFPGPGLAVRIPGIINEERLQILKEADDIYIKALKKWKLYNKIWQAFCVLVPIKTSGIKGDVGVSQYVISLRAVNSVDGMTANWFDFPPELLREISSEITNKVNGITRVLYDITNKPPATIEWE